MLNEEAKRELANEIVAKRWNIFLAYCDEVLYLEPGPNYQTECVKAKLRHDIAMDNLGHRMFTKLQQLFVVGDN